MKNKRCPYCSKRISYVSAFASRRKAEFVCDRCGKESRVVVDRKVIPIFIVFAFFSIGLMLGWIFAGAASNPLGILLTALPLAVFAAISPKFIEFEPLKKYKKSMEARKAGIEYSDNIISSELEENENYTFGAATDLNSEFKINSDVFNTIKAERNAEREKLLYDEDISSSPNSESFEKAVENDNKENFVPIINDVRENHSSAEDVPLKKIHSEGVHHMSRTHHYINEQENETEKPNGNKYSANRKF